ncbi:MAG: hypothetical protein LKH12_06580, partial [Prevotella sp.]
AFSFLSYTSRFKALKSLTLTPDPGRYSQGEAMHHFGVPKWCILGGQNAPYRSQLTMVVRISDYDSYH